jgi:hypothetical protein
VVVRLLISGIPATGKTTLARYLAAHHGYAHTDMEAGNWTGREALKQDHETFLAGLPGNALLSWGFGPYEDRPHVERLVRAGFTLVWLDGDHAVALRRFLIREKNSLYREAEYYGQMKMILATEVTGRLQPVMVDPFQGEQFRPVADIAAEVLRRVHG